MEIRYQFRTNQVALERIEGELIIISMDTGKYFSASGPAADILFLVAAGKSIDEIRADLENVFAEAIDQEDIERIVNFALQESLLEPYSDNQSVISVEVPNDYTRTKWTTPDVLEFSDLQDLILVDPVHDASLEGWPVERKNE